MAYNGEENRNREFASGKGKYLNYLLSFLEGIITFISPCLLPMIPLYLVYIAADGKEAASNKDDKKLTEKGVELQRALLFILGFSLVFVALGAFAGSVGRLLIRYETAVQVVSGLLVILFGLSYLGVFRFPFPQGRRAAGKTLTGASGALLFGAVFAVSWTPCVGAFLGSALVLASSSASVLEGSLLLLCYSAGLGVPFVLSALLLERLKGLFDTIKRHYAVINRISGIFLILVGILMATGLWGRFLTLLSL